MQRREFLGCPVDSLTLPEALDWLGTTVGGPGGKVVAVLNANKLYQMRRDARLDAFVRRADLIIPEWAVVWGARQLGKPLAGHVGGVMLLQACLPQAEREGWRLFFLGAAPEVVRTLEGRLRQDYPALRIAGCHHGYLSDPEAARAALEQVCAARPDILFVAMGSPKQEYWIEEHLAETGAQVAVGVGGSFDVLAGLKRDAPAWARGRGLEWLYRLAQDPRAYARRYLVTNAWFVWQVLKRRVTNEYPGGTGK